MLRLLPALLLLLSGCIQVEEPPSSTTSSSPQFRELVYEPTQCRTNPWQSESDTVEERTDAEARKIIEYYGSKGVTLKDVRFVQKYEGTCAACTCPRGDWIYAMVAADDASRAMELGWQRPTTTSTSTTQHPGSTIGA